MAKEQHKVHFIGIGGSGMSGLATVLLEQGYQVSGSDLQKGQSTARLKEMGAEIFIGHRDTNIENDLTTVVVSTAIKKDNPELEAARNKGIEVIRRGQLLAKLMSAKKGIAVAGAHGKTTTSSMISLVFEKCGLEPTIVVGGDLKEIGGNAKLGKGEYLVAEADESDGSFLLLDPYIEVITNIEDDHLDYYGSREAIKRAFAEFAQKVDDNGSIVACVDDENVRELIKGCSKKVVTYALHTKADYTADNIRMKGLNSYADIYHHDDFLGTLELSVPGLHNITNALAAVAVGMLVGLKFDQIASVLQLFRGAHRRFQLLGEVEGIRVVDDYAHHPTELKATLNAARQTDAKRVIAAFQPHRYSRTQMLYKAFGEAFADADLIIIDEIYPAGEAPIEGVNAGLIVDAVRENVEKPVYYFDNGEKLAAFLNETAETGDIILTLGAGNIWKVGVDLVNRLKERS